MLTLSGTEITRCADSGKGDRVAGEISARWRGAFEPTPVTV